MAKTVKSNNTTKKSSSLIKRTGTYSLLVGSKNISMANDATGKPGKYFSNTKVNRDKLTEIKGKPDVYKDKKGVRLIWW